MNRYSHILNRLLKAAKQTPRETPVSIPFALEARILVGWRSAAPEQDLSGVVSCFRRAVICAVLVMVMSIGWSKLSDVHEVPGAMAFLNLAKDIQIVP